MHEDAAPPEAALLLPGLFGGGEGGGLRCGEDAGAGSLATRVPSKKRGVLRSPQLDRVGEGEGAEIVGGDVAVLDQFVGLGQRVAHVDHIEMPDIRAEDCVELRAEW